MGFADDQKTKAIAATTRGIEDEVAALLKENYALVQAQYGTRNFAAEIEAARKAKNSNAESKINDEFRRMAREAIDTNKRAFTVASADGKNAITISLHDLNQKLTSQDAGQQFLAEKKVETLHQLVPNTQQVSAIANAMGAAAYTNASSWTNGWNNFWANKAAIANNVQTSVRHELRQLGAQDQSLAPFLTQGSEGTIEKLARAGHDSVAKPDAPAPDRVAATEIKPVSEAIRQAALDTAYQATFDATRSGINAKIEEGYQKNGFMGSMAKFMGPDIANFLIGILNFFIQMFGGTGFAYIPNDQEVNNASNVVAGSVRSALKDLHPEATAEEAGEAVQRTIRANLEKDKAHYPSFTPAQLDEMAAEAGKGVQENYGRIPKRESGDVARAQEAASQLRSAPVQLSYQEHLKTDNYQVPVLPGAGRSADTPSIS